MRINSLQTLTHTHSSQTLHIPHSLMHLDSKFNHSCVFSFSLGICALINLYIGCLTEVLGQFLQQQHSVSLILLSLSIVWWFFSKQRKHCTGCKLVKCGAINPLVSLINKEVCVLSSNFSSWRYCGKIVI
jgi:hypothetical protein